MQDYGESSLCPHDVRTSETPINEGSRVGPSSHKKFANLFIYPKGGRSVPMPKRASVDDYFARLTDEQRPHLEGLRDLSRASDPKAREELKWNLPTYVRDGTNLWMLQNFKNHCSLRFTPAFFATQTAKVKAAGYEFGAGFVKLPYDRKLPTELLKSLMKARIENFQKSGS